MAENNEQDSDLESDASSYLLSDRSIRLRSTSRASSATFSQRARSASKVSSSSRFSTTSVTSRLVNRVVKIFSKKDEVQELQFALKQERKNNRTLMEKVELLTAAVHTIEQNKEVLEYVEKIESLYRKKLERLDQTNVTYYVSKMQIGNENVIQTFDVSQLNELLVSYYDSLSEQVENVSIIETELKATTSHLENTKAKFAKTAEELQRTKDEFEKLSEEFTRITCDLENTTGKLETETLLLQEVTEDLKDMRGNGTNKSLKLEYTIGLTESQLMTNCVNALNMLDKQDSKYSFADLPERGKLGVMRILRKYCQKEPYLTNVQFADGLGIDTKDIDSDEKELNEDTCAWILVEWVQKKPENNADNLCQKFQKLTQYGSVRGTLGSIAYDVSVSRFSLFDVDSLRTAELLNEIKVIANGMHSMQSSLQRLNQQRVNGTDLICIASYIRSMQETAMLTNTINCKIDNNNLCFGSTCAK